MDYSPYEASRQILAAIDPSAADAAVQRISALRETDPAAAAAFVEQLRRQNGDTSEGEDLTDSEVDALFSDLDLTKSPHEEVLLDESDWRAIKAAIGEADEKQPLHDTEKPVDVPVAAALPTRPESQIIVGPAANSEGEPLSGQAPVSEDVPKVQHGSDDTDKVLDASDESVVEAAIEREEALADAYASQEQIEVPAKPETALQREIRLRREKGAVHYTLSERRIPRAVFYAKHPDFWDKERSERNLILHKFIDEWDAEQEREDERRAAKIRKPPVSGAERTSKWRAKKSAAAAKPAPTPRAPRSTRIPVETVSREWRDDRLASLTAWTAGSGPSQRHLRGHERRLVKAALLYQVLTSELRRAPSHGEFAKRLRCTPDAARNLVRRLERLHGPTGPWCLRT